MSTINSVISYREYSRLCANSVNDYVYILETLSGSVLLGDEDSLKNQTANDVWRANTTTVEGLANSVQFLLSFESGWDSTNFPDQESFLDAKVFGFINNNFPDGTSILVQFFETNQDLIDDEPAHEDTMTVDADWWLDEYTPKNDWLISNQNLTAGITVCEHIRIIVTYPSAPTYAQLGRLWVGNKFDIVVSNTTKQAIDADWAITMESEGFADRNLDKSSAQPVARPTNRLISFNKSQMNFEAAFGKVNENQTYENMLTSPSFYKMAVEASNALDVVALPVTTSQKAMKFTGIYGTAENRMRIQHGNDGYFSVGVDILELTPEPKK